MSVVIKAEHLSKEYRLGVINHGMLYKDLQSWMAKKLGRTDPHERIGAHHYEDQVDRFWALKDLNFDIEQGDRVGIIGRNGAGKSTLLKILSRITAPTEGTVKIKGRVASLLEVGTGFHGELTGRENIYLNGAILGMKKREIDRKIDEIIDFSEIEQYIDTPAKRYSSGMYVRLAFAVAASLDSDILIADEVLAVGDAAFQKKALGKMGDLSKEQGRTVLFVSHNMSAVSSLCSSGMMLSRGTVIARGGIDSCIATYLAAGMRPDEGGSWSGDEGDENIRIDRAALTDIKEGREKPAYTRNDRIRLRIEYRILQSRNDYVFCVEVLNNQGIVLCAISASDFFRDSYAEIASVGRHELEVPIDAGIFGPGDYSVRFDFSIRSVKRIFPEHPSLSFSIEDVGEARSVFLPKRTGVVSPSWPWTSGA
jgi:lipopolysaccharide transport system ATP-binding protein